MLLADAGSVGRATSVLLLLYASHLDIGNGYKSGVHHLPDNRNQASDIVRCVDNGDQDGLMVANHMRLMYLGGLAKAFQSPEDGGAGYVHLAALIHNGFIESLSIAAIGFGNINTQELSGLYGLHPNPPWHPVREPA